MDHSSYLSTGQLAALIGRSRETVRRYEALGLIPAGRRDPINGRRYWPATQADEIRRRLRPVPVMASVRTADRRLPRPCDDLPTVGSGQRADGADVDFGPIAEDA